MTNEHSKTYIVYNISDATYSTTNDKNLAYSAIPSEDLIVADISHWDESDLLVFEQANHHERVLRLEEIELFDDIKTRLSENPLV